MTNPQGIWKQISMLDRRLFKDEGSDPVFICYAHDDNQSDNPKERWLDRFLKFIQPLIRQEDLKVWPDKELKNGDEWHVKIQSQLIAAKAVVLFVSPAFLASEYIANNELPILLKRAKDNGIRIFQILISPSLVEEAKFKFPDPKTGPNTFTLGSLQAGNPPSRTLIEMSEAEQDRVLLQLARDLWAAIAPKQP